MKNRIFLIYLIIFSNLFSFSFFQNGNSSYKKGDYEKAIESYEKKLGGLSLDKLTLKNNLGKAYLQNKEYEKALKSLGGKSKKDYFNRGNAYFELANSSKEKASELYKKAVNEYREALKLDSSDKNLRVNYELALKKQEEAKKNQENQKDEKDQNQKDGKNDQDKQDKNSSGDQNRENESKDGEKDKENQGKGSKEDKKDQENQNGDKKDGDSKEGQDNKPQDEKQGKGSSGQQDDSSKDKKSLNEVEYHLNKLMKSEKDDLKNNARIYVPREEDLQNQNNW